MNRFLIAVAACALLVSFATAFNCTPPIFRDANAQLGDVAYAYQANTVANDVCPGLEGEESCCTQAFFTAVTAEWRQFLDEYAQAQVRLTAATGVAVQVTRGVIAALKEGVANGDADPAVKEIVIRAFDQYEAAVTTYLDGFVDALIKCINVVLRYMLGVICLSCRPDWAVYISESSVIRFLLADKVCDDLKEGCTDIYQLASDLVMSLNQTRYDLHVALNLSPSSFRSNARNPCRNAPTPNDCSSYACANVVRGLHASVDSVQDDSTPSEDVVEDLLRVAEALGLSHKAEVHALREASREVHAAHAEARDLRMRILSRAGESENSYSDSGFDVVAEGNKSNLEKDVSRESPSAALEMALSFLL